MHKNKDQLAYALVTPYSLHKSRTGGILARLLWADVHLSAVRMYAPNPDSDFLTKYCDAIYDPAERDVPLRYQRLLIQYVMENFGRPNVKGISNRLMVLVFQGPNAQSDIKNAVGPLREGVRGDDVRGTFGDFISIPAEGRDLETARARIEGALARYPALQGLGRPEKGWGFFEPAVLTGTSAAMTEAHLKLFREYAYSDGGFVLPALDEDEDFETSMVILKPESFCRRNPLPGNLIDFFSRLGLFITGAKMMRLSVEQAREFYGAKLAQFQSQLKGMVVEKAEEIVKEAVALRGSISKECGVECSSISPEKALKLTREAEYLFAPPHESGPGDVKVNVIEAVYSYLLDNLDDLSMTEEFKVKLAEELKDVNALAEFNELIRYMSGADPETGEPLGDEADADCMALLYSGHDSMRSIRTRLKELREVYGQNILHNRAHASDPEEDPVKETRVLGMPNSPDGEEKPCDIERVVSQFFD